LYIGPAASHITDMVEAMEDRADVYLAEHGEVERVVQHIRGAAGSPHRLRERTLVPRHSASNTLPKMLDLVEETQELKVGDSVAAQVYQVKDESTATELP